MSDIKVAGCILGPSHLARLLDKTRLRTACRTRRPCRTLGMLMAGGLNGLWIAHLIGAATRRAVLASRVMTAAVGLLNLAVGLLALTMLASPSASAWTRDYPLQIGAGSITAAVAGFAVAIWASRIPRTIQRSSKPADRPSVFSAVESSRPSGGDKPSQGHRGKVLQ